VQMTPSDRRAMQNAVIRQCLVVKESAIHSMALRCNGPREGDSYGEKASLERIGSKRDFDEADDSRDKDLQPLRCWESQVSKGLTAPRHLKTTKSCKRLTDCESRHQFVRHVWLNVLYVGPIRRVSAAMRFQAYIYTHCCCEYDL
jgi:hypothetical protein